MNTGSVPSLSRHPLYLGALVLARLCAPADAADIYRWTDDAGRPHLSDVVPAEYAARAVKLDSRRFTAIQTPQVQSPASTAGRSVAEVTPSMRPSFSAQPDRATSAASAKVPLGITSQAGLEKLDCRLQWRAYRENMECFAPYVRQDPFFVRPEAFEHCVDLKDPSPICGLETSQ